MSNLKLATDFAFNRGIDSVVHARDNTLTALPELQESLPCELRVRPHVDSLLSTPTLDDVLDDAIRPKLESTELMAPARFRRGLAQLLGMLRERATELEAGGSRNDISQQDLLTLQDAVSLLTQECDLRDMVQMYRSVLYQG